MQQKSLKLNTENIVMIIIKYSQKNQMLALNNPQAVTMPLNTPPTKKKQKTHKYFWC